MARQGLVWNFEDNNFTWMDASVIVDSALADVTCMRYGFEPGWVVRWEGLTDEGVTWADLQGGTDPWGPGNRATRWSDLYKAGRDQNFYWSTATGVWAADRVNDVSGVKRYYVERVGIDFNDVGITTNDSYKHVSRIYPLIEGKNVSTGNAYLFTMGWASNLMDAPGYSTEREINLNTADYAGRHKIDVRETGRYLAWRWDFTYTSEIAMTGADVDLEVTYGR